MLDKLLPLDRSQQGFLTVLVTVIVELLLYVIVLAPIAAARYEDAPPEIFRDSIFAAMWGITVFSFVTMGIIMRVHNNSEYGLGILKGCLYIFVGGTVVAVVVYTVLSWLFVLFGIVI